MTFGEIKTLVSVWLDDLNYGYFTQSQVETWVNNATNEVQKRLLKAGENFYTKCVITTLNSVSSFQTDYVLPSDFRELQRLEVITSGLGTVDETSYTVNQITLNQQDLITQTSGTPFAYYIKKNRLVVLPAPDQDYTLRMWYAYMVPYMVDDGETPDVPQEYHELIALLATESGFLRDDRVPSLIAKKIVDYQTMLDQDAKRRRVDQPRRVRVTGVSTYGPYGV